MASDDRSEHGPARFYTARLDYDDSQFHTVKLEAMHVLRQADGASYPSEAECRSRGGEVADIEAVRFDPHGGGVWYASEGNGPLHYPPFIRMAGLDGGYRTTLSLPDMFRPSADRSRGPRDNLSFEGLAFAPDGQSLWLGMEAPLYQDGPLATTEHGAANRITQFDRKGKVLAQYAYPLDRVQGVPAPGRFGDNGVSEILMLDARRLLVLERSGVQAADGRFAFYVRLYLVDVEGASNISGLASLVGVGYQPLSKRLLLDLNTVGLPKVDNVEGMSFALRLPTKPCSLARGIALSNSSDWNVGHRMTLECVVITRSLRQQFPGEGTWVSSAGRDAFLLRHGSSQRHSRRLRLQNGMRRWR